MRAARALQSKIPPRRRTESLSALRRSTTNWPASLASVNDRVVVREGNREWQADDGQFLLKLEMTQDINANSSALCVFPARPQPEVDRDWFEKALAAEDSNPEISLQAYERAVGRDPSCADAWINWGRLLYEQGALEEAESIYRRGLERCGENEWLHFNLAIALEDQLRTNEAIDAYLTAIQCDPQFADAHFNLARLYHARADRQRALRHLARYRSLTRVMS